LPLTMAVLAGGLFCGFRKFCTCCRALRRSASCCSFNSCADGADPPPGIVDPPPFKDPTLRMNGQGRRHHHGDQVEWAWMILVSSCLHLSSNTATLLSNNCTSRQATTWNNGYNTELCLGYPSYNLTTSLV